ncbi:MAG: Ni/Fe hydrogenase subunit alpha [Asgard group archaeon]|nr:Ni/Fe hydrogenase subunit alpha [Asgard group archaeon]
MTEKTVKHIVIDPVTRLEGHAKIDIILDDKGKIEDVYLQVPEFRGFEKFCEGRRVEELPRITPKICGVCPMAHHMASAKALDMAFGVEPTSVAHKLRELMYNAYVFEDHTLAFYFLQAPDFVVGPSAPPAERNILGVIAKVGVDIGKEVIKHRAYGQQMLQILTGSKIFPAVAIPGGVSKGLSEEDRDKMIPWAESCVEFSKFTQQLLHDVVLENKDYVDLILSDTYNLKAYNMGLVDENNKINFYDGQIRVTSPEDKEFVKFESKDYLEHVAEVPIPHSYVKRTYLKKLGLENGLYRAGPLARLNASEGMTTPLAQKEYEKFYSVLGGKPANQTLAYNWARVIEQLYAAERVLELLNDPEITSDDFRTLATEVPTEGVGVVEACRGTLYHHYKCDEKGLAKEVNLIVATTNNKFALEKSVEKAARGLIESEQPDQGILNMVEMSFRAYDPCMACATHSLPGKMPLTINLYDKNKNLLRKIQRK